nr:EOG090X09UC [Triops cancriformis]
MARNAEKAMTTLARWRAAHLGEGEKPKERRPWLASDCDNLREAERWRGQIIREISRKTSQIQNAGLGEFRIRDLNDEINKLLREKRHWERRIRELGGPDYFRVGPRVIDSQGKEVPGNRGYKYFGAAKDLPGVRELFAQEPPPPPKKTRAELMKDIDADYYGYRDDDDGILIPLEEEAEKNAIAKAVDEWKAKKEAGLIHVEEDDQDYNIYAVHRQIPTSELLEDEPEGLIPRFNTIVRVPSQKEIEEALLRRRKQELLEKFGITD